MAELRFEKGFLKGKTIQIPAGRYLIVGRAKEAGLPLPDPQLSRRHCKLTHTVDGILLEDLGSRNGTYVNGQPITTVKLRHGDQIHFGDQMAQYDHPKGLMDSSGDYESEEAEATREIPELQPGQAMLLNPPKIVRGPDSAPPPRPPTQIGAPNQPAPVIEVGLLPPSQALENDMDAELPQIDQAMPIPPELEEQIEADLSAPLPDLPPNSISMEETLVKPQRPQTDPAKAAPPKSKIKKLMESYKAEVMASTIDEVKPVPKAKPAASLKQAGESGSGSAGAAEGSALRPTSPATEPSPARPPRAAAAAFDDEAQIEAVLEATDQQMRIRAESGSGESAAPAAAHPKTIPLRRDPTPEEEAQAAQQAAAQAESFAEALLDRELNEEAEVIDEAAVADGPFDADADDEVDADSPAEATRELRPDETGEIDPAEILGAGSEIDIDTSRIDRHREIADEIFRAAQVEEEAEAEAQPAEEVIEEVDEDFDLDSLEQVAAPTLDLGKLDSSEPTAESATGIEALTDESADPRAAHASAGKPKSATSAPAAPAGASRKMTPPPSLPPIEVEEHLDGIGDSEDYSHCAALWEASKGGAHVQEENLLGPILAKNEEYPQVSE